ncbi:MAG: PHP domain-containing protein [Nitrospinota bacterium]
MGEIVADLHMHSSCSDGLHTPEALCELIVSKGINVFSLTDHDTVQGLSRLKTCEVATIIPGLELTATMNDKEAHILGYYINPENRELVDTLKAIREKRKERLLEIVDYLDKTGAMRIDADDLLAELGDGGLNRMNLARYMVKKGLAKNFDHCFRDFIGESTKAYRPVNYFSPSKAMELIHHAGGLAFLAHPHTNNVHNIIPELAEGGLDGLEAFHPSHGPSEIQTCLEWAARFKLGVSGGSDFHGNPNSPRQLLSAGLNGERLVEFLALKPDRDMVTV